MTAERHGLFQLSNDFLADARRIGQEMKLFGTSHADPAIAEFAHESLLVAWKSPETDSPT